VQKDRSKLKTEERKVFRRDYQKERGSQKVLLKKNGGGTCPRAGGIRARPILNYYCFSSKKKGGGGKNIRGANMSRKAREGGETKKIFFGKAEERTNAVKEKKSQGTRDTGRRRKKGRNTKRGEKSAKGKLERGGVVRGDKGKMSAHSKRESGGRETALKHATFKSRPGRGTLSKYTRKVKFALWSNPSWTTRGRGVEKPGTKGKPVMRGGGGTTS